MQFPKEDKEDDEKIIASKPRHRNTTIDSDDEDEAFIQQIRETKQKSLNDTNNRKRMPDIVDTTPEKDNGMEIEGRTTKLLKFHELPDDVVFYLTDIYPYGNRLFISGVMEHGQTFNLVVTEPQKEIYFCLRSEYTDTDVHSPAYLARAEKEINERLRSAGIAKFHGEFEEKEYVFELEGVPRRKRPYYKVRYSFGKDGKEEIRPDWEGETYKYIFGTSYTPLELFIVNAGVKGPEWVKIQKNYLSDNGKWADTGFCAEIQDAQLIQTVPQMTRSTSMRVMSLSIKAAVPSQVKLKRLFNTNRLDELHIYAISYFICEDYMVELKPKNYVGTSRTFFLKEFGAQTNQRDFVLCENEKQMFALFQAELRRLDPDVLVCHDSAKILDTLIQRMAKIGDRQERPRLGRLVFGHQLSKSNQNQRINSTIAGRLLCDTFLHSRDMIKSVDYELQSMATYIRPEIVFKGMSEEDALGYLNDNRAFQVVRKAREQAEITFALMNHLQILQITRQLSNICGNTWKRSLENQRAERNQYLIMHDCVKRDLIIPDKFRKEKNSEEDEEVDRKKYQGGHVIDPIKGFYKDYIMLLDFNSLYPSIIREYNVCFSVIKRPLVPLTNYYRRKNKDTKEKEKEKEKGKEMEKEKMEEEEEAVNPPSREECTREKWGFLPQLIDKIVARRKKCKKDMKSATAEKVIILDIQQKCYKLVANSIYGCLGFSISRFYSKHLAALITRMGRQALLRAKQIVSSMGGVRVIYGDTDSLMIQPQGIQEGTEREKLLQIKKAADQLKKNINKEYVNLEIDVDGIFKPLILLMKKKYVARKLTNFDQITAGQEQQPKFNIEFKGIEVVRRDGFELARRFLRGALEILMNSQRSQPQQTYEQIYEYAGKMKKQFSEYSYKEFLFSKQLNKHPDEYNRGETIPHVKVAKDKIKAGERVETLVNHTIYYIVCKPKDKNQDSLAKCCFDDRTYERSQKFHGEEGPLEIDEEYYKRELLQPVWRITQHLEDFSTDRILEEIGLTDEARKKFKRQMEAEREEGEANFEGCISHSTVEKAKQFSDAIGEIICGCGIQVVPAEKGKLTLNCPACGRAVIAAISNRMQSIIKQKVAEYYTNTYKCRCGKQYGLNLMGECCKIKNRLRSNVPFDLHKLIYLGKDLCMATLKNAGEEGGRRIASFERMIDTFLDQSDYEHVASVMSVLKI